ncbi:MAG TPA: hypothetical protein VK745_29605 [Polyangiaceae bacterium]|jgi:hypothetical protein|nr:hypothetical protein [Polyangiaceae bacterium]
MCKLVQRLLLFGLLLANACSTESDADDSCNPGDQDGVVGGNNVVLLSVSDAEFAVGGVDSGSTEPNIAVQNLSNVTLTLTNVGTRPHSLQLACIPTGLPATCPQMSCFPGNANIPPLAPGDSVTTSFTTPAVEGAYQFTSTVAGDSPVAADGGVTGLVGEFVLM